MMLKWSGLPEPVSSACPLTPVVCVPCRNRPLHRAGDYKAGTSHSNKGLTSLLSFNNNRQQNCRGISKGRERERERRAQSQAMAGNVPKRVLKHPEVDKCLLGGTRLWKFEEVYCNTS